MSVMRFEIPINSDIWMLNGIETFYTLISGLDGCRAKIEPDSLVVEIHDLERFLKSFANRISSKQDEIIFSTYLDKFGQPAKKLKPYILQQFYLGQEDPLFKDDKRYEVLKTIFKEVGSNKKRKVCVLCGNEFSKPVRKNLTQGVYPFVTKIKSLSGVRTLKENYDNLCPLCYLIGTLEWLDDAIIYRCPLYKEERNYSVIFLPFELNLEKLHESKNEYRKILTNKDSPVSNLLKIIKSQDGERAVGYEGEYTTILKFFEKFVDDILGEYKGADEDIDKLFGAVEKKFCKSWVMLKIPSGNVKNVKLSHLDLEDDFIRLLISLERKGIFIYDNIIDKIDVRDKNNKPVREEIPKIREFLAKAVVFGNFREFSRVFLPRKNVVKYHGDLKDLDELIKLWGLMPMGIEGSLEDIKNAARNLAKLLKNHLSILYEMDKVRTKEDFIRVYQQACRRLLGVKEEERKEIYPPALEKFADLLINSSDSEWKTLRDVLLIYTSIYVSKVEYKGNASGGGEK